MLRKTNLLLMTMLMFGAAGSIFARATLNAGTWNSYSTDGRQANTNYKIKIFKTADYTSVTFAGQKEYITITGSQIRITNFSATGKISSDGNRKDQQRRQPD